MKSKNQTGWRCRCLCLCLILMFVFHRTIAHDLAVDESDFDEEYGIFDGSSNFEEPQDVHTFTEDQDIPSETKDDVDRRIGVKYGVEIVSAVLAVFVLVQMYLGKEANKQLACAWLETVRPIMEENFAKIGVDDAFMLLRGWSTFEFFASGRMNCKYCLISLECVPRQCLWWKLLSTFIVKQEDSMNVEIALDSLVPCTVAIGRRRHLKSLQSFSPYIGEAATLKNVSSRDWPPQLCVITDTLEAFERLMPLEAQKILLSCQKYVKAIILSDSIDSIRCPKEKLILRAELSLPPPDLMNEILPLMHLLLNILVDSASGMQLSDKSVTEVIRARSNVKKSINQEKLSEKMEAVAKKRAEKKREEEDRLFQRTPEQQRKLENKQHKKDLKNRGPKIKSIAK